jgi:serine protease Do
MALLICSARASAQESKPDGPPGSPVTAALEKVKPALVFVREAEEPGTDKGNRPAPALGVIVDPKGTVVTNHSAIKGMKKCVVVLHDDRKLAAKAFHSDPNLDLTVIRIEDAKPLPSVEVGDSEKLKMGDRALALAAPWAVGGDDPVQVVRGLVGGKARGAEKVGARFLVDTALGPGCGPGPVFSLEGKFVGLAVGRDLGPRTTGSAVPSNRIVERVAEWSKKK